MTKQEYIKQQINIIRDAQSVICGARCIDDNAVPKEWKDNIYNNQSERINKSIDNIIKLI